ncbi:hypothetical protein SmphiM12_344 [Sinorhizobium phage phiM12]|uniref:Uncharacterized protein n=1 Tax=Sinorhizobium phage phiM12 TaxID=1357423 RepID=S5M7E9_9CAUD|nr:hypothetical protein AB690_gp250 [Sinorhizobium phage phiM12]AGR47976.1 hypothetical protein SmphiM12_344 [Sinorhizobium phage phiM12]
MKGPRSLIVTTTDFPFRWLVTLSFVPNLRDLCAAVMAFWSIRAPEAVCRPCSAYHEAPPQSLDVSFDSTVEHADRTIDSPTATMFRYFNDTFLGL